MPHIAACRHASYRFGRAVAWALVTLLWVGTPALAAEPTDPPPPAEAVAPAPAPADTPEAAAKDSDKEPELTSLERLQKAIRVIQRRPVLKDSRFELQLGGGFAAADRMFEHWLLSATGRFHISEWVSVGATYGHYFSERAKLFDTVTKDFEVFPELSEIRWYAGAEVSVVPIDGKFVAFGDGIMYWDLFATLGGGVTVTSRSDDPKPTGVIGVGMRFYIAKWLTFTVELRDHLYFESFRAGDEFVNNVVGQAGFSFFLPFSYDYEYPR